MAATLKMAAMARWIGGRPLGHWRRGWASGRKAGAGAGVVARAPPTPVAAAPELLYERAATRFFVLVHVAALSQAMFWCVRATWERTGHVRRERLRRTAGGTRHRRSSLTYMAWAFWQEPKTLAATTTTTTAETAAETGGERDDLSKLRALAPDRTRYQAMAVFATVGTLFVGAIELFAFRCGPQHRVHPLAHATNLTRLPSWAPPCRNVRRLVLQDGKLLVRTFALLPAWQNFALPASSAYVAEALQGTDGGARTGDGGADQGEDVGGLAATRTPFVLLRVRDKKWTYLLDKSGSFPKPARFDALFVRAPSS